MTYYGLQNRAWQLEERPFAKGGEGALHHIVGDSGLLAKLYLPGILTPQREKKLRYMVGIYDHANMEYLAWPIDILRGQDGQVQGFIMRRFASTKDMADLLAGESNKTDDLNWNKRVAMALNLSALTTGIHDSGQIIGDMNPKNFGVDMNNGHVFAFDTDSFHLYDANTHTWYPTVVGLEAYYAPELLQMLDRRGLDRIDRARPTETFSVQTDRFALAVLVFQLLFNGTHPFTARRMPSMGSTVAVHRQETNIRNRMCPYFNPSQFVTFPSYAPPLNIVPDNIQQMFRRAFLEDDRPSADEWATALTRLLHNTRSCVKGHVFSAHLSSCPWCAMERQAQVKKPSHSQVNWNSQRPQAPAQPPQPAPQPQPKPQVPPQPAAQSASAANVPNLFDYKLGWHGWNRFSLWCATILLGYSASIFVSALHLLNYYHIVDATVSAMVILGTLANIALSFASMRLQYSLAVFKPGSIGKLHLITLCDLILVVLLCAIMNESFNLSDAFGAAVGIGLFLGAFAIGINSKYYSSRAELFDGRLYQALRFEPKYKTKRTICNIVTLLQIAFFVYMLTRI